MIVKFLIEFAFFVVGLFFQLVTGFSNNSEVFNQLATIYGNIFTSITTANTFLHFMFGDFYGTAISLTTFILSFKFVVVPVVAFCRKVFVWGGGG